MVKSGRRTRGKAGRRTRRQLAHRILKQGALSFDSCKLEAIPAAYGVRESWIASFRNACMKAASLELTKLRAPCFSFVVAIARQDQRPASAYSYLNDCIGSK